MLVGLPGLAKFSDPECKHLIQLARSYTGNEGLHYLSQAYIVCYENHPCDADCEQGLGNLQNTAQQGQINNLQRQQNLNTYLWLQQVNK